eukprot:10986796-Lingulodinium_polyedra.AAC.1
MDIHWATPDGFHHRKALVPPRVVENGGASTLMGAVDAGIPQLSVAELNRLATFMKFMLLAEHPDGAKSCLRKLAATAAKLAPNI